jgi:bifunctional UDP-N-acetylglucosamine pyrophosphorylase/glucosamine-1-phosphate N-acetyltransferase
MATTKRKKPSTGSSARKRTTGNRTLGPVRSGPRPLAAVILAAGQGKRMRSPRAKVVHEVAGLPLVGHVIDATAPLGCSPVVVVVGHDADSVRACVAGKAATALQREQLGTGHAVLQAKRELAGFDGDVLVLCGDVPLLRTETLRELVRIHRRAGAKATVLSAIVDDPSGYGRIVRGEADGELRIVEDRDAAPEEHEIDEINTGTYCFDALFLFRQLSRLGRNNAQGEYYLTDLVEAASRDGSAACVTLEDGEEGHGVNTRADLARIESILQERLILRAMEGGVTFLDPATAMLSARTRIGEETVVGPNVRLDGDVRVGRRCVIEGSAHLRDTVVEDGALLRWGVVADRALIGAGAKVGPFAHLRPEAELGEDVHIGNFVEVKKATVGARSKANHLAYIGDATVGRDVNIGAGTITCNYDGVDKHRTTIGDRVQIGSDTQLVAPVSIGEDAYIAAGSTISKDVEPGSLAFNEKPQRGRAGWVEAFRKRKAASKAASRHAAKAPASSNPAGDAAAKPAAKSAASKAHAKPGGKSAARRSAAARSVDRPANGRTKN